MRNDLYRACEYGNLEKVKEVLCDTCNVKEILDKTYGGYFGDKPLRIAIINGHLDVVKFLLLKGADINYGYHNSNKTCNAMIDAIKNNQFKIVKFLVEDLSEKIHINESITKDAFVNVCGENDNYELVNYLIKYGFDSCIQTDICGIALIKACEKNASIETVKLLLSNGANIDYSDYQGNTSLLKACETGAIAKVSYLINSGCDINILNNNGDSAMHLACKSKDYGLDIVRMLVEHDADINIINYNNELPIHYACRALNLRVIKYLIESGAKIT